MSLPFEKCPTCGGEMVRKKIEKLLRGGNNMAVLAVEAEVCLHCGEHLYDDATIRRFEQIRAQLATDQTEGLTLVGRAFQVQ